MLTSQVNRCDHAAVQLQFFETVVRYEKFFGSEPHFLPDVLVCCFNSLPLSVCSFVDSIVCWLHEYVQFEVKSVSVYCFRY